MDRANCYKNKNKILSLLMAFFFSAHMFFHLPFLIKFFNPWYCCSCSLLSFPFFLKLFSCLFQIFSKRNFIPDQLNQRTNYKCPVVGSFPSCKWRWGKPNLHKDQILIRVLISVGYEQQGGGSQYSSIQQLSHVAVKEQLLYFRSRLRNYYMYFAHHFIRSDFRKLSSPFGFMQR